MPQMDVGRVVDAKSMEVSLDEDGSGGGFVKVYSNTCCGNCSMLA